MDAAFVETLEPRPVQVGLAIPADVEIDHPIAPRQPESRTSSRGRASLVTTMPTSIAGFSHDIFIAGCIRKTAVAWR